jgi:hypothetical protein
MWTRTLALVVVTGLLACGDAPPPTRPAAPTANDPAFTMRSLMNWYIVGNGATPGDELMTFFVDAPAGVERVDAWIDDATTSIELNRQPDGSFGVQVPLADYAPGVHEILLGADGASVGFAKMTFRRSAPYYVLVTTDWDFADPSQPAIGYQNAMHRDHPELRMTHFVGPYTFTDPAMTAERKAELVTWLLAQRDNFTDEIGLHIHPYCHFVEAAGVTCITDQSVVYSSDPSGYTIKVGAYDRATFGKLLDKANELFEANGLNRPRTFRAGAWTATLDTLGALADKGFVADTSALNWARIEEWENQGNRELYRWNMANWTPIDDTSQPYWVSQSDVLLDTAPTLPILEVPDNGVMIDYVTLEEMNGLFDTNWDRAPLATPTSLMMGFHPAPGFSNDEYRRVDGFLDYADMHLASRDLGPVVYITLEDIVRAYAP